MSTLSIVSIVFVFVLGGAFLGMALRTVLPEHHLSAEPKEAVRLGAAFISTLTGLVLGLLVASAKGSYDTHSMQIRQVTANVILLDQMLAKFGPEADASRHQLRRGVAAMVEHIWRERRSGSAKALPFEADAAGESLYSSISLLAPRTEAQRMLQGRAIQTFTDLAQLRFSLFAQKGNAIPMAFLALLIFWLMIIFTSFGLFARPNATLVATMTLCALSASGAIFLILELGEPFSGLLAISNAQLSSALAPIAP